MAKKTWTFKLGGQKHQIAVAHMPATGKGGIWVNGALQRQKNVRFKNGSVHHFYLGEYALAIYVKEFGYDLTINGISLDLLKKRRAEHINEAHTRELAEIGASGPSLMRQVMAKRQERQSANTGISKLLDTNTMQGSAKTGSRKRPSASVHLDDTPAWSVYDDTPTDEAPARQRRSTRFNDDPLISTQPLEDDTPAWAYAEDDYDPFADDFDDDPFGDSSSGHYEETETESASSGGWWMQDQPLFADDVFAKEKSPSIAQVEDNKPNLKKPKKNNKKAAISSDEATPTWAWIFIVACGAMIVFLGALPWAIGFGGASAIRQVSRNYSLPVELRVMMSAGIVIVSWAILFVVVGGISALVG